MEPKVDSLSKMSDEAISEELSRVKEKRELLEAWRLYNGRDKVITSEELARTVESRPEPVTVMSGFDTLDGLTDGFHRGELVVISAPTGMGKTTFLQTLNANFSDKDIPCMWFSYEVSNEDLLRRFDKPPFFVLPKEMMANRMDWLSDKVWEGVAKYGVKMVFIDHLHFLLSMSDLAKAKSTSLLIGMIMRDLKKLAVDTDTTIFLVAHLSKTKLDERPNITDLRDSSFVGQEADMVMLLWRGMEAGEYTNEAFLKVEKNRRTGRLGSMRMLFDGDKFRESVAKYD